MTVRKAKHQSGSVGGHVMAAAAIEGGAPCELASPQLTSTFFDEMVTKKVR
jgi:hypothetical protein